MYLVIINPNKKDKKPYYEIQEFGMLYVGGKTIRTWLEEASDILDGRRGYLVFDSDDENAMKDILAPLLDARVLGSPVLARIVTDVVCNNNLHPERPEIKTSASFWSLPNNLAFEDFQSKEDGIPFAFWINTEPCC